MYANIAKNGPCSDNGGAIRILVLNGSPHRDGPVGQMLDDFCSALPDSVRIDWVHCYGILPLPCDDCGYCHDRAGCCKKDLQSFYPLLEAADVLVFATPVHNLSFSAPLKTLLDRTQCYWAARFCRGIRPPITKAKQAILLTSAGKEDASAGKMVERQLLPALTILNARLIFSIHYSGADVGAPLQSALAETRGAAAALFECLNHAEGASTDHGDLQIP